MQLNELEKIMPAPSSAGESIIWKDVEKNLGVELPDDYKCFVEKYGTGWVGDFLLILDPSSAVERYSLIHATSEILNNYQSSKESFPLYYEHISFDGNDGIFPCGITDNADVVYWQYVNGVQKNIVVYNARGGEYFSVESSLVDFICNVLTKSVVCE